MNAEVKRWLEIALVLAGALLSGIAAYYNMDARVLLIEQKVQSESVARVNLQNEVSTRMEKIDTKLEKVADKIDRMTEIFYERRLNDKVRSGQ
jgi:hypothetical protein